MHVLRFECFAQCNEIDHFQPPTTLLKDFKWLMAIIELIVRVGGYLGLTHAKEEVVIRIPILLNNKNLVRATPKHVIVIIWNCRDT